MLKKLFALALVIAGLAAVAHAKVYTHSSPDFTLDAPDKYVELPSTGDSVYNFATSDPANGVPNATISVQRLHGMIGRESVNLKDIGLPDARFDTPAIWKSYSLDIIAAHLSANNVPMAARAVQIPLAKEAIQIIVVVPIAREDDAYPVLREFLDGLDGTASWPAPAVLPTPSAPPPAYKGTFIAIGVVVCLATGIVVIGGLIWLIAYFSRRSAKSNVPPSNPSPPV